MKTFKLTEACENGKNLGTEKEVVETRNLIVFKDGEFKELLTARWYMARSRNANRVYCSIWIYAHAFGEFRSGHAHTDGYGFCKLSDAFEHALNSAGVYSSDPISGRGMSVVDEALINIATQAGYDHAYIARG